jgi:hypothetical protein
MKELMLPEQVGHQEEEERKKLNDRRNGHVHDCHHKYKHNRWHLLPPLDGWGLVCFVNHSLRTQSFWSSSDTHNKIHTIGRQHGKFQSEGAERFVKDHIDEEYRGTR